MLVGAGDVVVANDAATLPASLAGVHLPTGASIVLALTALFVLACVLAAIRKRLGGAPAVQPPVAST